MIQQDCIQSASPETQHVNQGIRTMIRENLSSICLYFVCCSGITALIIVLYINSDPILHGAGTAIKSIPSVIWWCITSIGALIILIIYYYARFLRYVGIGLSGIGYDISAYYCTLPHMDSMIHAKYLMAQSLPANGTLYYDTPSYYSFCIADGYNAGLTFGWAHIYFIVHMSIMTLCIECYKNYLYPYYAKKVEELNNQTNRSQTQDYAVITTATLQIIPIDRLKGFIYDYFTMIYLTTSVINYMIRYFIIDKAYVQISILALSLFLSNLILPIVLLKRTPFRESNRIELEPI